MPTPTGTSAEAYAVYDRTTSRWGRNTMLMGLLVSYLGPAAMYQAFMIGNIANKLLPSAIVAQAAVGAKPGNRRAELAAVMAICGAAIVHIFPLLLTMVLAWVLRNRKTQHPVAESEHGVL